MILELLRFVEIFEERALKIYKTLLNSKNYYLLTLDVHESVFDCNNVIYPLTNKLDTFVIVKVGEYRIGYIKGIITTKNDIYSIEYLMESEFIWLLIISLNK